MACAHGERNRPALTIDILSDDIFQEIFAFCLRTLPDHYWTVYASAHMKAWQTLVHVCQRWRQIIYASPRYFNLQLYCTDDTPFMKNVGCWPEFPLVVRYYIPKDEDKDEDDLIAALKHPDRIHRVELEITSPYWGEVFKLMQVPFPALTHLKLEGFDEVQHIDDAPELPDGFLGGSAPCLQHLDIKCMVIPDLPTLLLSARDLVSLELGYTPMDHCYGYISPETMVEGLAVLTRLKTLRLDYPPPIPLDEPRRHPNPPMLAVLPALTEFEFRSIYEYLEDLLAQIDTPHVHDVRIIYFGEEVQTSQLSQFIDRTANIKLAQFRRAKLNFQYGSPRIILDLPQGECCQTCLTLSPPAEDPNSPVQSMVHLLSQLIAMLSNVNHLSVGGHDVSYSEVQNHADWLPLLHLFPAMEVMEVHGELARSVASALEDAAEEMVTMLLPALQVLWLTGDKKNKTAGSTERFLSLRQLCGRPVTIVNTQDEFVERLNASGCSFVLFD